MNKHFRLSGSIFLKLEELGVRASAVLRRAGLPQGCIDQPRVLLTTEELFAFWRAVGEVSTDPTIGLLLGTETKIQRFQPIGLAALSTEDFGSAIGQIARYKQLTCPEEILQEKDDEEWSIQFRWLLADDAEPPVLNECCFAWVLSIARHGTGTRLSPLRVEFVQPRPHVKAIERHFGCPVVCGTAHNAIVFRAADAERLLVTRNAELLGMLAPQFEEELKQENGDVNFVERVRIAVQQKLAGRRPTIEDIADALHISSRTLQRHLQDEGFNFQRVLEEARHQLARHYLNNSVLELNEAAYLLGYNDANSFVRAFRSWEGIPPARWREKQRAKAVS
ncbi:MAG TPA: AraC family transcriptional regulator [Terriglobales bacterium]|nr:AraC family transcriptional regulator [Terriglobales bacterium]